jgi:integrase
MPVKRRKRRIPQLCHTNSRGIGYYVAFRDPDSGVPRKVRFGNVTQEEAQQRYHEWLGQYLRAGQPPPAVTKRAQQPDATAVAAASNVVPGSLLHVTSGFIRHEEARAGGAKDQHGRGSITRQTFELRRKLAKDFLAFLNGVYGKGAVGRMMLADLTMKDVEDFNAAMVKANYSANYLNKQMQVIKAIIDRAGRPEYSGQVLGWNWESRDVLRGRPARIRALPTVAQLEEILSKSDVRERAMIWLGIGLGFGHKDLADLRVGQIDADGYDLRRSKTGQNRFGSTPPGVWHAVTEYLKTARRPAGQLMFVTSKGMPLVHDGGNSVVQWWTRLRNSLSEQNKGIDGFYVLRHLGATEFGSRPGCSISDMRRWLGHATSSRVADLYMKPVSPEYREVVNWVRAKVLAESQP